MEKDAEGKNVRNQGNVSIQQGTNPNTLKRSEEDDQLWSIDKKR